MKWPCDSDNPGVFLGSAALAAALLFGVLFFVGKLMVDQAEAPAGEYVSGEAIEEEKAKEVPLNVTFGAGWDESIAELGCTGSNWWRDEDGELQIELTGCTDEPEETIEPVELTLPEPLEYEEGEFSWSIPDNSWILGERVYLGEDPQKKMTVGELLDRLSVLDKTIAACCGTQYIDPDAEQNLTVMVMLRKKVMELEARILALEHR